LFQLGSSRYRPATASEDQALDVLDLRASHPWLAVQERTAKIDGGNPLILLATGKPRRSAGGR
ncbi:hypothetical protein, partial [Immundisolibacter sp.]